MRNELTAPSPKVHRAALARTPLAPPRDIDISMSYVAESANNLPTECLPEALSRDTTRACERQLPSSEVLALGHVHSVGRSQARSQCPSRLQCSIQTRSDLLVGLTFLVASPSGSQRAPRPIVPGHFGGMASKPGLVGPTIFPCSRALPQAGQGSTSIIASSEKIVSQPSF
jgi:hypothetical protein